MTHNNNIEWVSISQKLPKERQLCLVFIDYRTEKSEFGFDYAIASIESGFWNKQGGSMIDNGKYITHWAYLEPPK